MTKELATFGGGCFWCVEAVIQRLKGVEKVVSGYSGGQAPGHPTYREVCSGRTGHAEVIQVEFDADEISYFDLLMIFMTSHDPTTLNRQGADRGTQYRSVIFYHDDQQKKTAEDVINKLSDVYADAIVTELSPLDIFYAAEDNHQNYYNENSDAGYCRVVIAPKLSKLRQMYAGHLKEQ
jgi:peptide-methionine (S)-S-oxide reductase